MKIFVEAMTRSSSEVSVPEIDCFSGLRSSVKTPRGVGVGISPSSLEEGHGL